MGGWTHQLPNHSFCPSKDCFAQYASHNPSFPPCYACSTSEEIIYIEAEEVVEVVDFLVPLMLILEVVVLNYVESI